MDRKAVQRHLALEYLLAGEPELGRLYRENAYFKAAANQVMHMAALALAGLALEAERVQADMETRLASFKSEPGGTA